MKKVLFVILFVLVCSCLSAEKVYFYGPCLFNLGNLYLNLIEGEVAYYDPDQSYSTKCFDLEKRNSSGEKIFWFTCWITDNKSGIYDFSNGVISFTLEYFDMDAQDLSLSKLSKNRLDDYLEEIYKRTIVL